MNWGSFNWGSAAWGSSGSSVTSGSPWGVFVWGTDLWGDPALSFSPAPKINRSAAGLEEQASLLGKDIFFNGDYEVSSSGDYATVSGLSAIRQSVLNRLMVNPGEFKTRPSYGAGVRLFVKKPKTTTNINTLKANIRTQLSREERIEEVLAVEIATGESTITISIAIRIAGKALRLSPFVFNDLGSV